MSLKGRVAIITGGSRGIGKSIALAYAAEGAVVVVISRNAEHVGDLTKDVESTGGLALSVSGSVSKKEDVERVVEKTIAKFGRIDILVNNAGTPGTKKDLQEVTDEEWDEVMNVNVRGVFLATRCVLPWMLKQGRGNIVNISSGAGEKHPSGGSSIRSIPYSVSKFALEGFNYSLASRLKGTGINVNAIKPGVIKTAFHDSTSPEELGLLATRSGGLREPKFVNPLAIYLAALEPGELTGASMSASEWNAAQFEIDQKSKSDRVS